MYYLIILLVVKYESQGVTRGNFILTFIFPRVLFRGRTFPIPTVISPLECQPLPPPISVTEVFSLQVTALLMCEQFPCRVVSDQVWCFLAVSRSVQSPEQVRGTATEVHEVASAPVDLCVRVLNSLCSVRLLDVPTTKETLHHSL